MSKVYEKLRWSELAATHLLVYHDNYEILMNKMHILLITINQQPPKYKIIVNK